MTRVKMSQGTMGGEYKNANEMRQNPMPFNQFSLAQLDRKKQLKRKRKGAVRL